MTENKTPHERFVDNCILGAHVGDTLQSPKLWVIYSVSEDTHSQDGAGFWSNEDGWTVLAGATCFTEEDTTKLKLPVSSEGDARWVLLAEAEQHY